MAKCPNTPTTSLAGSYAWPRGMMHHTYQRRQRMNSGSHYLHFNETLGVKVYLNLVQARYIPCLSLTSWYPPLQYLHIGQEAMEWTWAGTTPPQSGER